MKNRNDLLSILARIDGKGYKAYIELKGMYDLGWFTLFIDHVQGDPFAAPSRIRVRVPQKIAGFPSSLYATKVTRVALEDFLTRRVAQSIKKLARGNRGTGKSGLLAVDTPGQEVLERSSMVVNNDWVEVRLFLGLPAHGRRILAREAREMLLEELPKVAEAALMYKHNPKEELAEHINTVEDAQWIRDQLSERGLVAFVAEGSILPRRSGISDEPLPRSRAIPFQVPPTLQVTLDTPNHGPIAGMGIPRGITLIVGGGYHGKSTLLRALERGVYNHVPGDGREFVVTVPDAVKIRAEDGRRVEKVDISPFINNLPLGQDTVHFSTEEASGSTSQAANIIEAIEIGTSLLLIDEDTSATNFMIRDVRMQQLVAKDKEPITPFIDKVRQLYTQLGISSIIVIGGAGDYFDVADTVIMMAEYVPYNVTSKAKEIAEAYPTNRRLEGGTEFGEIKHRVPLPDSFNPRKGHKTKIGARDIDELRFGTSEIELFAVEQLVDKSQTRAIGDAIYYAAKKYCDGKRSLKQIIDLLYRDLETHGLDLVSPNPREPAGDYAWPRKYELAAAINRLRTLKVR